MYVVYRQNLSQSILYERYGKKALEDDRTIGLDFIISGGQYLSAIVILFPPAF